MTTSLQHGTCQDSAITSGTLYTSNDHVLCSRGCEDVPTMSEITDALDPGEALLADRDGTLYVGDANVWTEIPA